MVEARACIVEYANDDAPVRHLCEDRASIAEAERAFVTGIADRFIRNGREKDRGAPLAGYPFVSPSRFA